MDALTVAVDKLHRAVNDRPDLGKANITKRVVLVSNFLDAAKEDPDDQFGSVLVDRMQDKNIRMEVCPLNSNLYTDRTSLRPMEMANPACQTLGVYIWVGGNLDADQGLYHCHHHCQT